jgi:hypothetical protein
MDKGLINGVAFIYLKKAFDTVDHALLLAKLERCGVRETPLKWFKSYLHQRKKFSKSTMPYRIQLKLIVASHRGQT